MKVPRQARLESAILLALRERDAASVADLALRIDASRASTSRAFARLLRKGLVRTEGRRRSLTAEGRQEASDLLEPSAAVLRVVENEQRQIQRMIERAQVKHFLGNTAMLDFTRAMESKLAPVDDVWATSARALQQVAASSIASLAKSMSTPDISAVGRIADLELDALRTVRMPTIEAPAVMGLGADAAARRAEWRFPKGALSELGPNISRDTLGALAGIGAAAAERDLATFAAASSLIGRELAAAHTLALGRGAAAAMDAMRLQVDALGPAMRVREDWVSMLTESVALSTRIVDDVSAMAAVDLAVTEPERWRQVRVSAAIDPVIIANRDNAAAELGLLGVRSPQERQPLFITPSVTTRELAHVARLVVNPSDSGGAELPDAGDLFEMLEARGMKAACRELRGARDAIDRLPDGWAKTASHLLREAMREVLLVLAPDDEIEHPPKTRVTRKMRIRHSVGRASETLTSVIDSSARGWDDMVGFLSAEAHNENDARLNRDGMIGGVIAVEGLIRLLIAAHDIAGQHPERG